MSITHAVVLLLPFLLACPVAPATEAAGPAAARAAAFDALAAQADLDGSVPVLVRLDGPLPPRLDAAAFASPASAVRERLRRVAIARAQDAVESALGGHAPRVHRYRHLP